MSNEPLLRVIGISKQFGSLAALQNLSLEIRPGEVVGLAGRSGAGKSVLIDILAGLQVPDSGSVFIQEKQLQWPFRASSYGINVIHQEPQLAERLDVTSNIFLGN